MPHKFKSFTTVAVLFIGYLIIYFDKSAIGYTILGMQHDFHFSNVQKGGVMSAFFIGYGVMQLPIALINNRLGSKRLLVWAMIGIALFAYLTNFATSIIVVALLRLLAGAFAHAGYAPSASKTVALTITSNYRGRAIGALLSTSGIAGILIPLIVIPIMTQNSWHTVYTVLMTAALIVGILLFTFLPRTKPTIAQPQAVFKESLHDKSMWQLAFLNFSINLILYGLSTWMPSYLADTHNFNAHTQTVILASGATLFLVGIYTGSFLVDRFFVGHEARLFTPAMLLAALSLLTFLQSASPTNIAVSLSLAQFFMAVSATTSMTFPVKYFDATHYSTNYAIFATGGIIGGAVSPTIIGVLVEMLGGSFSAVFVLFFITAFITGLSIRKVTLLSHN
ncbi:MFS transporter [Weissella cibaria]|uniref:MFS transporter n=1 Tax=Weissella cibaria TaxID=137591 RepID=UPI0021AF0E31|nr:MFS transporter [Weissella cibaria]MCT0956052.1 MFS transporter [Weissella cibaria]